MVKILQNQATFVLISLTNLLELHHLAFPSNGSMRKLQYFCYSYKVYFTPVIPII